MARKKEAAEAAEKVNMSEAAKEIAPVEETVEKKKAKPAKTSAKKAAKTELKKELILQFSGKEYTEKEILKKVKENWTKTLKKKVSEMKHVQIYLKPEEAAAYFVVNGDITGKVEL